MIILHVTDLHFQKHWFNWLAESSPHHDLLVITGDLLDMAHPTYPVDQIAWVSDWVKSYQRPITLCSGYHDHAHPGALSGFGSWIKKLEGPMTWVDGQKAEVEGVSVLSVAPGEPREFEGCPIWAVHRPPPNLAISTRSMGMDQGDEALQKAIRKHRPHLVMSGHIHEPMAWHDAYDGVLYLNPGSQRGARFPNHIIVDSDQQTLLHVADYCSGPRCSARPGIKFAADSQSALAGIG